MQKFNFVTDGSVVYRLGGNEWYAVVENNYKVLLVDTDCKVGNEELSVPWLNNDWQSEDGQSILDYCNSIADTYFGTIKWAIMPRIFDTGVKKSESVCMWPMPCDEFIKNNIVCKKVIKNSSGYVWLRTLRDIGSDIFYIAPAFYLKKSAINQITEDGEIVLKLVNVDITN